MIDWCKIREDVQQEYEDNNMGKCFVVKCNKRAVKARPIRRLKRSHIDLCDMHNKEDKVDMDMRKFFSFGFGVGK